MYLKVGRFGPYIQNEKIPEIVDEKLKKTKKNKKKKKKIILISKMFQFQKVFRLTQ
jgi:DNA topoisomerase-1